MINAESEKICKYNKWNYLECKLDMILHTKFDIKAQIRFQMWLFFNKISVGQ